MDQKLQNNRSQIKYQPPAFLLEQSIFSCDQNAETSNMMAEHEFGNSQGGGMT